MQFQIDNIYGSKKQLLLKGTDIEIKNYAITMISGQNGTGKTLLLNKMFELCINKGISAEYVEQSNKYVLTNVSIAQNISMSNEESEIKRAENFLCENGMGHLLSHKPKELSGGEKRLICIMRSLFSKSNVIFIDEPTNDLDVSFVERLKSLLNYIKLQKTVIIVSHDDRIRAIADSIINIENKELNCIKLQSFSTKCSEKKDNSIIKTEDRKVSHLLKKCSKKNLLSRFVIIITVFVSIYATFLYMDGLYITPSKITDNEINIFTPNSQLSNEIISDGAVPIRALSCFDDSLSLKEKLDIYTAAFNKSSTMPINYGLYISESTNYNVFELEYYDTINKEYFYSLDNYKKSFGIKNGENIDTSNYFIVGGIEEPKSSIEFSVVNFKKSKDALVNSSKYLECTFVAISINSDETLRDFINSSSISQLMNGNFYIRSAETIKLTQSLKSVQNTKNITSFLLYIGIILLLVDIIVSLGCLISNKLSIRIFRNIGMSWKDIYNVTKKQYTVPLFRFITMLISIIICTGILFLKGVSLTLGSFASIIFISILTLTSGKSINIIAKKYIKRVCSWRFR